MFGCGMLRTIALIVVALIIGFFVIRFFLDKYWNSCTKCDEDPNAEHSGDDTNVWDHVGVEPEHVELDDEDSEATALAE